jgi:hypothetical protein
MENIIEMLKINLWDMNLIKILTDKDTACALADLFEGIALYQRSIELQEVKHFEKYSEAYIRKAPNHETIDPIDIFYLGYYTRMQEQINKQKGFFKPCQ